MGQTGYSLQVQYSLDVKSCMTHSVTLLPELVHIRLVNRGCQFIGLVVKLQITHLRSGFWGLDFEPF